MKRYHRTGDKKTILGASRHHPNFIRINDAEEVLQFLLERDVAFKVLGFVWISRFASGDLTAR